MAGNSLEILALEHFDDLLRRGELLWTDTPPLHVKATPIDFEFRVAPAYEQKPILAEDAKGRFEDTKPFGDDDPAFTISNIADTHLLRLNKFCVVRPQFVLHTIDFQRQNEQLSTSDCVALWCALCELGRDKYAAIYNCGAQAGSSIGHKHMQLFPKLSHCLFPDVMVRTQTVIDARTDILEDPRIHYKHAITSLDGNADGNLIFKQYLELCRHLELEPGSPHNVFVTNTWIIVIPRSQARVGALAANAASMLGLIWVKTDSELEAWRAHGPAKALEEVGVPWRAPQSAPV